MLWEAELCKGLYGAKAESALSKTQNSCVNNEQTNLQQLHILTSSCEYECEPMLGVPVPRLTMSYGVMLGAICLCRVTKVVMNTVRFGIG